MNTIKQCTDCGSDDIEWHFKTVSYSCVQDGRLRLSEVSGLLYLGCNYCSHTIREVSADSVASDLTDKLTGV